MKTCLLVFLCSWLALSAAMFLGPYRVAKDGKDYTYWSWVETVRTPGGPRQQTVCYLGELNSSAQARWLKTVEVFNEHGERRQWKLSPSDIAPPENDPDVAQVWVKKIRLERARQFGNCFLGLELWKGLGLDRFWKGFVGGESVEVPWSRVAALLAIHRWCAQSRVDQFQGADAGAKIAACIAALPASGGTCDATMLTGPQNIGQLRIAHSKVQVLLGTGTYKVAEGIDIEADGVVIQGISGTIIQKTGKGFAILLSGAGHVISRTTLDHLHLVGDPSTFNGGIGVAIHPGCGADFVTIENVVVDSFGQYGIIVSGKVNDLTVRNVRAVNHGSPDAAWPMIGIAIDPKTHSERLVMDNVFSEIDHSNGKASAAIKVQNFRTATVTNLTAVGGTEETLSVAGIGDLTASNWTIRGGAPGNQGFGLMLSTESNNGDPTVLATGPRQWNFDHISFEGTFHPNFAIVFGRPGNKNVKLSYISARGLECVMTQNGWAQDIKVENSEFGQFNLSRYPGTLFHDSVLNNVTIDSGPLILPGNRNLVSSATVRGGTIALIGSNNVLRFSTSSGSNGNGITLGGDMNVVYHCNVTGQRASAIAVNRGSGNLVHGSTYSGGVIDQGARTMLPGRDGGLVHAGSGPPSGSCASGAVYVRTDGAPDSTLYVCDSGSWSAK